MKSKYNGRVVPDISLLSTCGHYYVTWAPYSSLYDALKEVWAACCIPINNIWYEFPKGRSLQNIATVCKAEITNKITSLWVCSKCNFQRFYKYNKLEVVVCECMGSHLCEGAHASQRATLAALCPPCFLTRDLLFT